MRNYVDDRYLRDPMFKNLVDLLHQQICTGNFTPTEIREAAILAQVKYEMGNPRPFAISPDLMVQLGVVKK